MVLLLLSPTFPFFFIAHFLDYQKVGKKSRNFFTTTPIPKWRKLRKDHFCLFWPNTLWKYHLHLLRVSAIMRINLTILLSALGLIQDRNLSQIMTFKMWYLSISHSTAHQANHAEGLYGVIFLRGIFYLWTSLSHIIPWTPCVSCTKDPLPWMVIQNNIVGSSIWLLRRFLEQNILGKVAMCFLLMVTCF